MSQAQSLDLRQGIIRSLLETRCERYLPYRDHSPCNQSVLAMVKLLDFDVVRRSVTKGASTSQHMQPFVFIAFKKKLIERLSQPSTTTYLQDLLDQLNQVLLDRSHAFNLWDFTLKAYSHEDEASQVVAALFQDTSPAKLHLAYLEQSTIKGSETFKTNKELLARTIDTIHLLLDYSDEHLKELFYPDFLQGPVKRSLYHFYVPAYLARALGQKKISPKFSYLAPLLMTLTYEFVTTGQDLRYLYQDPKTLDPLQHEGKLMDIFAGYSGARFGIKGKRGVDFETLKELFGESTSKAVKTLLVID